MILPHLSRMVVIGAMLAVGTLSAQAADNAPTAQSPLALTEFDRVEGAADAPVTVIEYASLTCGHCKAFHDDTYPKLKENYIETGKVKFAVRSMPWNNLALAASKVTYCAPKDRFPAFYDALMATQEKWTQSDDPIAELRKISRLGGMGEEEFNECMADHDLHQKILTIKREGEDVLGVKSTPTVFVGKSYILEGNQGYAALSQLIDKALEEAKTE